MLASTRQTPCRFPITHASLVRTRPAESPTRSAGTRSASLSSRFEKGNSFPSPARARARSSLSSRFEKGTSFPSPARAVSLFFKNGTRAGRNTPGQEDPGVARGRRVEAARRGVLRAKVRGRELRVFWNHLPESAERALLFGITLRIATENGGFLARDARAPAQLDADRRVAAAALRSRRSVPRARVARATVKTRHADTHRRERFLWRPPRDSTRGPLFIILVVRVSLSSHRRGQHEAPLPSRGGGTGGAGETDAKMTERPRAAWCRNDEEFNSSQLGRFQSDLDDPWFKRLVRVSIEHSRSSQARHLFTHAQTPTEFSTELDALARASVARSSSIDVCSSFLQPTSPKGPCQPYDTECTHLTTPRATRIYSQRGL